MRQLIHILMVQTYFKTFNEITELNIFLRVLGYVELSQTSYISGTTDVFSSGSWATLNYLKLLPTPKSFKNLSQNIPPSLSKNVFSRKELLPNELLKNNNKLVSTAKRVPKWNDRPNENIKTITPDVSESRSNSIFDFDVEIPTKVKSRVIMKVSYLNACRGCLKRILDK